MRSVGVGVSARTRSKRGVLRPTLLPRAGFLQSRAVLRIVHVDEERCRILGCGARPIFLDEVHLAERGMIAYDSRRSRQGAVWLYLPADANTTD